MATAFGGLLAVVGTGGRARGRSDRPRRAAAL